MTTEGDVLRGGLHPKVLHGYLDTWSTAVGRMLEDPLPQDVHRLAEIYEDLGRAVSTAEACLVSALDALDPRTGGGVVEDVAPFRELQEQALLLLHRSGAMFARLDSTFGQLVHGGGGWSNRPVEGGERTLYLNTFKTNKDLNAAEREQEYLSRVDKFVSNGGSFDDIIHLNEPRLDALRAWSHYDYVMLPNLETRVYPTAKEDREGKPKAGHSLLIGSGHEFDDREILSAGEMWVIKDTADDLESVIIANNSGHFKPSFKDLPNTVAGLVALGVPEERIVLFGGPNNIPAIFREMGELCQVGGLEHRLPVAPVELLRRWYESR
jgi:hypothetical protein